MPSINSPSSYIFLSPHPDDVALSCGGWVWQLAQAGEHVEIWTICAGDPPEVPLSPFAQELHTRWGAGREALATRREEDIISCTILGAQHRHFNIGDCIYRRHPETGEALYASEEGIFSTVHPSEMALVSELTDKLRVGINNDCAQVICPLSLGGHIDHRLTRRAAQQLNLPLWYYLDYPYVLHAANQIPTLLPQSYHSHTHPVGQAALIAWQDSVAAHHSQISTFWPNDETMRKAIKTYCESMAGIRISK